MSTFTVPARASKTRMDLNSTQSLVDPEWELIDPVPDIHNLFQTFNNKFFIGKLACVELEWSKRMYQCAGICYSRGNRLHMSCVIRLSEPLLKLRSRKELIETLLHEMIHAWNFIRGVREENGGHGPQFLSKMREINLLAGTNITVYHSFHDEVEVYKTHWWRCDGPCKDRKPYFGYVKRTSNRAPSKNDLWWAQHQANCGGTFVKIKEPEKKAKKKAEPKKTGAKAVVTATKKPIVSPKSRDIRNFFPREASSSATSDDSFNENDFINKDKGKALPDEGGTMLGGSKTGRSRLLDAYDNAAKKRKLGNDIPTVSSSPPAAPKTLHKSMIDMIKIEFGEDHDDIIFIDDEFDDSFASQVTATDDPPVKVEPEAPQEFCNCPICNAKTKTEFINKHLDECLTMQLLK